MPIARDLCARKAPQSVNWLALLLCLSPPGNTAWNIDFAADSISSATFLVCVMALAASALISTGGRGGGISAGGVGLFGSIEAV
jgi:hypothetical protein